MSPTCASPDCDNPVPRRPGTLGRPPIYCSPACRPSRNGNCGDRSITVEVDQQDDGGAGAGRSWVVRIRRAERSVVVGRDLGRFSATVLAGDLRAVLQPRTRQEGDAIE
ncbi:MAG: hypothetical protein ACRD12_02735 [Acidimicrobiales bacterium]